MQLDDIIDVSEFRSHLQEMQVAFKKGMEEEKDSPQEMIDLLAAMGRLEKELENKKSQQIISDFYLVFSFVNSLSDDDEDEAYEDEFDEEEEEG